MTSEYLRNSQWIVTELGIEPRSGIPYAEINVERLLELRDDGSSVLYEWPLQMEAKSWVDLPVFIDAWLFAIERFHRDEVDWQLVARTLRTAMKRRIRSLESELGEAGERIPGYYEISVRGHDLSEIDLTDRAGKRWRGKRYAPVFEYAVDRDDIDDETDDEKDNEVDR